MKTIFFTLVLGLTISFSSCNNADTNSNQRTKSNLHQANDLHINILTPETVKPENELYVRIHVDNKKYKLMQAFFACNIMDTTSVDTFKNLISGCDSKMFPIENDTVRIRVQTGPEIGTLEFPYKITLLVADKDKNFYYDNCNIKYSVK